MTNIVGTIFLAGFSLVVVGVFVKFYIETNHKITMSLKRNGVKGTYYQYKKIQKKMKKSR
ncbi:hypothetical protein [Alkalibacter saccharofermentans]|uniref:Uncharacterized protein n=1 Tax=Alkalibacter saccharofermentans DSM 14828 TaxID=1120975 RepID=A0A1M4S7B6_9FIRM|nr:hypothetical protein [Alkalibacter saccharofermentans]SHE28065.1 hypothetical protein SAMN02746064_00129 [Alkalibacter saccharofermentans DSM 14828]